MNSLILLSDLPNGHCWNTAFRNQGARSQISISSAATFLSFFSDSGLAPAAATPDQPQLFCAAKKLRELFSTESPADNRPTRWYIFFKSSSFWWKIRAWKKEEEKEITLFCEASRIDSNQVDRAAATCGWLITLRDLLAVLIGLSSCSKPDSGQKANLVAS